MFNEMNSIISLDLSNFSLVLPHKFLPLNPQCRNLS
ncbi:MAG TPA: hypothetical protein K8V37_00995 [Enterococcus hirae]|nr:hypothetical protein [Enterococcus hirae]